MHNQRTIDAAHGYWRGILMDLGMPSHFLKNKHGPCPLCGGKDRFRWDNKQGSGSYHCSGCGAGMGMDLAMKFTKYGFKDIADRIDAMIDNLKPDAKRDISTGIDEEKRKAMLREVWVSSSQMVTGDMADKYLSSRGIHEVEYPKSLRYAPSLRDGEGGIRPCMVAVISDVEGNPVSLHRTFLGGGGKAIMDSPRKLMAGSIPEGSCIRLTDAIDPHIGIAEGIETAMSASRYFSMPVWAVVSTAMMEKFKPPQGVEKVSIFGDNDVNYAGQKSAYALAHKLHLQGFETEVILPSEAGKDWNDIVLEQLPKYQD